MRMLSMREQELYLSEGLPPYIASLLSRQKVPRGEVAGQILALLEKEDAERLQLERKATKGPPCMSM